MQTPLGQRLHRVIFTGFFGCGLVVNDMWLHELERQPRGHCESNRQRDRHAQARVDRNRAHVGTHQARHKGHWQQCCNDRERCQYGRPTHFIHRQGNDVLECCVGRELLVPVDVLHHHNRIVDQNTDREDECKERHPIQGKAPGPGRKQRGGERQDHRSTHDDRFAFTQGEPHQQDHRTGRKRQFLNQLVGFFGGGFAVVSGHRHFGVGRDDGVAQRFQPCTDSARHIHCILARLLGHADRHRRVGVACHGVAGLGVRVGAKSGAGCEPHIALGLLGAGLDAGHITQEYGLALVHSNHQVAYILRRAQELAGIHSQHLGAGTRSWGFQNITCRHAEIGGCDNFLERQQVNATLAHAGRLHVDPNGTPGAAHRLNFPYTRNRLELDFHRVGNCLQISGRLPLFAP